MNKNYLITGALIIGIIVVGFGGFIYMNQGQKNNDALIPDELSEKKMTDKSAMSEIESMEENKMTEGTGRYIEYSNSAFADTLDSNRVLYFYANWCPICRPVDKQLRENEDQIPEGMTIIRVNYNDPDTDDDEKALAKKYGITYQHTFVQIDKDGNEITKWNGGGLDEILENTK